MSRDGLICAAGKGALEHALAAGSAAGAATADRNTSGEFKNLSTLGSSRRSDVAQSLGTMFANRRVDFEFEFATTIS